MKKLLLALPLLLLTAKAFARIPITAGVGDKVVHTDAIGAEENQVIELIGTSGSTATVTAGNLNVIVQVSSQIPVQVQASTEGVRGEFADNGVAAGTNRLGTLPSIYQNNYLNGTAATQGRNGALSQGTDGLLWTANLPSIRPASFIASTNTISVASSATDFTGVCGNATNTVLVYGCRISGTQTTAGTVNLALFKRSTKFTGAWSTMTVVAEDSNYAGAVSSAVWFTANPTAGTPVGMIDNYKLGVIATATASPNDIYVCPADWRMKPIVLRGTAECLMANLGGSTVSGGAFTATWNWIETSTISP